MVQALEESISIENNDNEVLSESMERMVKQCLAIPVQWECGVRLPAAG